MKKITLIAVIVTILSIILVFPSSAATVINTATVVVENSDSMRMDCAKSANILREHNWNFEEGEAIWHRYGAYNYTLMITDEEAHDGKYSLKLDGLGTWSCLKLPFNVKKNTNYTISFWVKARAGYDGKKNSCYKVAQVSSGDYTKVEESEWFTGDKSFKYTDEWYQNAITVNSGENEMLMFYLGDGGGEIYFDEFCIFETNKADKATTLEPANMKDLLPPPTEAPTTTTKAPTTEITTSESVNATNNDVTTSSTLGDDVNGGVTDNMMYIIIAIAAVIVVTGGGLALWAFKFRKAK
ncbi:MAG: carbohydrate binding domain-containing protein [Desulfitobacteriaceae bacterium]|nr:carbohydrate binding domain-containing protein [Desulfitobacteriaceae bacterium]